MEELMLINMGGIMMVMMIFGGLFLNSYLGNQE